MGLSRLERVRYTVSWQNPGDAPIPASLEREDISIYRLYKPGLSNNRNNAIAHCTADIIMFADDDVTYYPEGLYRVIQAFEDNPYVDFATFRSHRPGATSNYPDASCALQLPLPKGYTVCSIEIALRRSTAGHLRCHPELGLGSPLMHGGEDELLLLTAIRRRLNCRFFPITVCAHPHLSTGNKSRLTGENLRAMGCVIALTYPLGCILRLPLKAWRVSRAGQSPFLKSLYYLASGALRAPFMFRHREAMW